MQTFSLRAIYARLKCLETKAGDCRNRPRECQGKCCDAVGIRRNVPPWKASPAKSAARVLKGTRMPVSAIFENLEAGANIDDIMQWYEGLDREQVKAVIEFAVRSLDRLPEHAA
jgi:hypothetical protein